MYHKLTEIDCLSVATKSEKLRLNYITDFALLNVLAKRWCDNNGYKLGGYIGNWCWDSTSPHPRIEEEKVDERIREEMKEYKTCELCCGMGKDANSKSCWLCGGQGKIEIQIQYPPSSSYVNYTCPEPE